MVYISPDIFVPARILLTRIRRHLPSFHVSVRQTVTTLVVALRQLSPMALIDPHRRATSEPASKQPEPSSEPPEPK